MVMDSERGNIIEFPQKKNVIQFEQRNELVEKYIPLAKRVAFIAKKIDAGDKIYPVRKYLEDTFGYDVASMFHLMIVVAVSSGYNPESIAGLVTRIDRETPLRILDMNIITILSEIKKIVKYEAKAKAWEKGLKIIEGQRNEICRVI